MRFLMNSGRTITQGKNVEFKLSTAYQEETSRCFLHPFDMMELGIQEGDTVRVRSPYGSIVLTVMEWDDVTRGILFIPYGPYANHITGAETHGTGMPDFKSIVVDLEPTAERKKTLAELMEALGGVRCDLP